MKTYKYPSNKEIEQIIKRPLAERTALKDIVRSIIDSVKQDGDRALRKFSKDFDKVELESFAVTKEELESSQTQVPYSLKEAIETALRNIETFHSAQRLEEAPIETTPGVLCWRKAVAISSIGLYIPGGSAPLFSTLLMLGVPAQIAGCKDIVLCTPPNSSGIISPAILYTASLLGITQIYKVGGAQAIAALAYGTESISKVFKIFGPGNQYVTCAKELIREDGIEIDLPAGPSELCVIADKSCPPAFVAADLLSQAEHGPDSQVLLISNDEEHIQRVTEELWKQLASLPRRQIAAESIKNSSAVLVKDLDEAIEISNRYAPEHLILATENAKALATRVQNAGSVFLGPYSPEAAGDYASGTNHTLPTNGYARACGGLSIDSFVKKITFQELSREGLTGLSEPIQIMAQAEGLMGHARAVAIRFSGGIR